jgi:type II secretory pathway pseudopilin PulG
MRSGSARFGQRGFTYLAVLVMVAALGGGLAAYGETWSRAQQREKELELVWVGNQIQQAIGLYYQRSPGTVKRFPERLDDLLEDKRFLSRQRYLRRIYRDPLIGKAEWGLVSAPQGGIMGVYSLAEGPPLRNTGISTYRDWRFEYVPPP